MEIFEKLFGSLTRVKLMKLFLFNPEVPFDVITLRERTKAPSGLINKELSILRKSNLIKPKNFSVEIIKKGKLQRKRREGYMLDESFPYLFPLQNLLINTTPLSHAEIEKKLSRGGRIKLIIIAGLFIRDPDSRIDILIVGDNLKKRVIENAINSMESDIGREVRYSMFETQDFMYRMEMYDKLVRDVLDFPHEKVLNKLGVA